MSLRWMPLHSAADLWGVQSTMALRQSVPGALTTLLYRGCSGNQNDLTWGDFALNNPMNRTMDLQLIPAWLFPEMNILNGSDAVQSGGYGLGGQIDLRPSPEQNSFLRQVLGGPVFPWVREISLTIGTSGERSMGLAMRYSKSRWFSSTRMLGTVNPNLYMYRNTAVVGSPRSVMSGADWDQKGILQHLRYQYQPRSYVEIEIWAQGHRRGIPASLTSRPNSARQNDSMLRIQTTWHQDLSQGYHVWIAQGYQKDLNRYLDTLQGISGLHRFELLQSRTGIEYKKFGWHIQARAQWDRQRAQSSQYVGEILQDRWALVVPLALNRGRSDYKIQFQKEFLQGQSMPPAVQFRWNRSGPSRLVWLEYRRALNPPSFNDRFWVPGGNLALRPEKMQQAEFGGSWYYQGRWFKLKSQGLIYARTMRDKIWWQPLPNQSWWSPSNLDQSQAMGLEASLQFSSLERQPHWALSAEYQGNRSWAGPLNSLNPQLPYVPIHKAWVQGIYHRRSSFAQIIVTAVSSRSTTLDGTESLPAYVLCHAGIGYEKRRYRLSLGLRNLTDVTYQEVPWFPQPGSQAHVTFYSKF
ncbi:MAG: hypothetical protein FJ350_04625 [Sphingomonadales bacterium]|nr:hypothetical protein [Sphingomonadales bacterium]